LENLLKYSPNLDKEMEERAEAVPKDESEMVDEFLSKFVFTSTSANKPD
jgi:hypothetical protein